MNISQLDKNYMKEKAIIFLRIAWMKHYQGVNADDIPTGAGSYVEENEDGGEVCNFLPIKGKFYGYARIQGNRNLRLENLGAEVADEFLENVLIILFAKNPESGGQYVVGYYKDATLYREVQFLSGNVRLGHRVYNFITKTRDGHLINAEDRIFEIPKDGPGQTNAWYVERYHDKKYIPDLLEYVANPELYISRKSRKRPISAPWQKDIEIRRKVEETAMAVVATYFANRNFEVNYVHKDNFGWDLEAKKDNLILLLEVKGLSGDFNLVELTPNEYANSKRNKKHYRLCVVSFALEKSRQDLDIFYFEGGKWVSNDGKEIAVQEITSARFVLK